MVALSMKKPFFCIIFGGLVLSCCAKASALTFNWSTIGSGANGSGTFEIAETAVSHGDLYQLTSISGTFDGNAITGLLPPGTLWWATNNAFEYDAVNGNWLLNNSGVVFSVSGSGAYDGVDLWSAASSSASDYRALDAVDYYSGTTYSGQSLDITSATATLAAVPAPLPLLGLGAATAFSRKLKQRIALRRKREEVGEAA
jgi:hypothetical protein